MLSYSQSEIRNCPTFWATLCVSYSANSRSRLRVISTEQRGSKVVRRPTPNIILGGWLGCRTGNRNMGRMGHTDQCCPFCPSFHFLCDILISRPVQMLQDHATYPQTFLTYQYLVGEDNILKLYSPCDSSASLTSISFLPHTWEYSSCSLPTNYFTHEI